MSSIKITFTTSEFTPPPYAHEVELIAKTTGNEVKVSYSITYLDREEIDEEEILNEGFSLEDDFTWTGTLPNVWKKELEQFVEKHKSTKIKARSNQLDTAFLVVDETVNKGIEAEETFNFLEKCKQAIFELEEFEAPMHLEMMRIADNLPEKIEINASFVNLAVTLHKNETSKQISWNEFEEIIKDVFSGEYYYEKAANKLPRKRGLYVNLGNEWWFEVGKSLNISPKILQDIIAKI